MPNFTTFLWFDNQAEEAAQFYASIFRNARIGKIARHPKGSHLPEGLAMFVEIEMLGQKFVTVNGFSGKYNEAVHLIVNCETQEEVDYYWKKLLEGGGEPGRCGWLTDRFGLTWEVTPDFVIGLHPRANAEQNLRVIEAMMSMSKLDGPALQRAFDGE